MRHLSAFVLLILLIGLPSCKFFKERGLFNKKDKALAIMLARQDSIHVADSIRNVQNRLLAIEIAKQDSIRKADEEKLSLESRYNIIVGSFITPEYAKGLAEVYRNQGYDTRIIKMEGNRFELVSAEGHENFRKAFSRLKEFQDTVDIDAWMYIKK